MISPSLSSKFLLPVLTAGPTGTLAIAGTEYSQSDLWAISVVVVDGAGVTSLFVGGVAEEEMA